MFDFWFCLTSDANNVFEALPKGPNPSYQEFPVGLPPFGLIGPTCDDGPALIEPDPGFDDCSWLNDSPLLPLSSTSKSLVELFLGFI